ncbi:hypothetical protein GCM10009821_13170 [Aeromicrobium halocynthiae]|uniref:Uncharacterized protein n=1 Tax=Aeromicrobium halocynthiae TaxID=560557 RepID=A0ABN2VWG8_9ACTN
MPRNRRGIEIANVAVCTRRPYGVAPATAWRRHDATPAPGFLPPPHENNPGDARETLGPARLPRDPGNRAW